MVEISMSGSGGKGAGNVGRGNESMLKKAWDKLLNSNGQTANTAAFENKVRFSPGFSNIFPGRGQTPPGGAGNWSRNKNGVYTPSAGGGNTTVTINNNGGGNSDLKGEIAKLIEVNKQTNSILQGKTSGVSASSSKSSRPSTGRNYLGDNIGEQMANESVFRANANRLRMQQRSKTLDDRVQRQQQVAVARQARDQRARHRRFARTLTAPLRFLSSPSSVITELAGGDMIGGPVGAVAAMGGAAALETGLAGIVAGRPYASFRTNAGFYGSGAGLGQGFWGRIRPSYLKPPMGWASVGISQQQGLDILRHYPMLPAHPMGLVRNIGLGRYLPAMGQFSDQQLAKIASMGPQFGLYGHQTPKTQAQYVLQSMSTALSMARRNGLSVSGVQSAIGSMMAGNVSAGVSPMSLMPAIGAISPFFRRGIGSAQASYMANQAINGLSTSNKNAMGNPMQLIRLNYDLALSAPGAPLRHMLGNSAYSNIMNQNPKLMHMYAQAYNGMSKNPNDRGYALYLLSVIQGHAGRLSAHPYAFRSRNYGGFASRFSGSLGPIGTQLATAHLANTPFWSYSQSAYGGGLQGHPFTSMSQFDFPYSGKFAQAQGLLSGGGSSSAMRDVLAREGVKDGGMQGLLLNASKKTGVSAAILGSISMNESSGGTNPAAGGNVMQMTPVAMHALVNHHLAKKYIKPSDMTRAQSVKYGSEYYKYLKRTYPGLSQKQLYAAYNAGFKGMTEGKGAHYAQLAYNRERNAIGGHLHLNPGQQQLMASYPPEGATSFNPRGDTMGILGSEMGFAAGRAFEWSASKMSDAASTIDKAAHLFYKAATKMNGGRTIGNRHPG